MLFLYTISLLIFFFVTNAFALDLKPISNPAELFGTHTTPKREASFTGDLDLRDFESFFWGAPAGTNLVYANLTVYFPEQYEHVIAMERFADKLKSVKCAEDMMLEFIDDTAFSYAKDVWNWVNQDVNNSFIMVTNYEGCADDMERLPFVISNIRYDEENNKAHLTADLKEWEDIAHSYDLNVGHMPLTPTHRMLMERGVMPRATDFTMSIASSYDKNLFSTTVGGWTTSVDAVVRTAGSLNVDFDISVKWLQVKSASMTITPENIAASIQLALTEKGTLKQAYNWQKTIISIPIQGISILKVVKLGAFLDVDVGFTMDEWTGTATANFGARMEISNAATVKVDLVNSKNNRFSGWTPTFTPIPLTLSAKVEGSAEVYAEPNIKLEASALSKGWNVGLNMKMPYIQADFAAMYDSTGVCDSKKTLGVDIDASVGVELSAQAATKGHEGTPFWKQDLYSNEWPLFSKCLAFGPKNAKSGEVADPAPPKKTKKPKSKKPKSTKKKAKATKKPSLTSKKPKSTKVKATTESSKKTPKPTPEPTKASKEDAKKTSRTSTHRLTTDDKIATSTGSKEASISKSTKLPSSTLDISVTQSTSSSSSATTLSVSSITISTISSFTNSSRVRTGPVITVENPTATSDSESRLTSESIIPTASQSADGDEDDSTQPTTSEDGSKSRSSSLEAGTTTSPSTFLTATSTSTSSLSTSTSLPDTCPVYGCKDCKDSLDMNAATREYFDIEVAVESNNKRLPYQKRFDTRTYTYVCKHVTKTVTMASYPQFRDYTALPHIVTVSEFFQAVNPTNCLNHAVTTTAKPSNSAGPHKATFSMEHIYEGNWILNFLRHLEQTEDLDCSDMETLFFTATTTNNAGETWVQALMESLGSRKNQDMLVFLRQNINGAKFRIFNDGDSIIAAEGFDAASPVDKMAKIAIVGRALDYLAHPSIGKKLLATAQSVEDTLNALAAQNPEGLLGPLAEKGVLEKKHREWLHGFMSTRNAFATVQIQEWASAASEQIVKTMERHATTTVGQQASKTRHTEPTLKFLQELQDDPPSGFDAGTWAPLL